MALVTMCDGCGAVGEAFTEMGLVLTRHYCAACAPKAQAFLDQRDAAHDKAAKAWQDAHRKLADRHSGRGFKLPDQAND